MLKSLFIPKSNWFKEIVGNLTRFLKSNWRFLEIYKHLVADD